MHLHTVSHLLDPVFKCLRLRQRNEQPVCKCSDAPCVLLSLATKSSSGLLDEILG